MSLLATFSRLEQKLDRHARVIDIEQRRGEYRQVLEEILTRNESLQKVLKQVQLFRESDLPMEELQPLLQDLVQQASQLERDWQTNPDLLLQDHSRWERLRELEEILDSVMESIYEQVHQSWQGEALPAFYAALTRYTPLKPLVDRIHSIDADLPRLLPESLPSEANKLRRAKALKAERDQARKELEQAIALPLRELFAKITRGEATLGDLTPELLQELKQYQADRSVRLSLR